MESNFVPYELALELKELGFNEECLAYFKDDEFKIPNPYEPFRNSEMKSWFVSAPLWQQAFDWIEQEHKLYVMFENILLSYCIVDCREKDTKIIRRINTNDNFINKLEVKKDVLKKIIEIIKNDTK